MQGVGVGVGRILLKQKKVTLMLALWREGMRWMAPSPCTRTSGQTRVTAGDLELPVTGQHGLLTHGHSTSQCGPGEETRGRMGSARLCSCGERGRQVWSQSWVAVALHFPLDSGHNKTESTLKTRAKVLGVPAAKRSWANTPGSHCLCLFFF